MKRKGVTPYVLAATVTSFHRNNSGFVNSESFMATKVDDMFSDYQSCHLVKRHHLWHYRQGLNCVSLTENPETSVTLNEHACPMAPLDTGTQLRWGASTTSNMAARLSLRWLCPLLSSGAEAGSGRVATVSTERKARSRKKGRTSRAVRGTRLQSAGSKLSADT
jgi:hypothetical protein